MSSSRPRVPTANAAYRGLLWALPTLIYMSTLPVLLFGFVDLVGSWVTGKSLSGDGPQPITRNDVFWALTFLAFPTALVIRRWSKWASTALLIASSVMIFLFWSDRYRGGLFEPMNTPTILLLLACLASCGCALALSPLGRQWSGRSAA